MAASSSLLKTYCIIGDPVSHSLSPGMQNAAFVAMKLNSTYIAFRVTASELQEAVGSLRASNVAGFNVTIPHKVEVMKYIDRLDPSAAKADAVNTVNNIDGRLVGYNTDIEGFIEPLKRRQISMDGFNILLIGAGGAARAVIAALSSENGIAKLVIANRDQTRAESLSERAVDMGIQCEIVKLEEARIVSPKSDLIVNASAIGLRNEPSLINASDIKKGTIVYDLVYQPVVTGLIENARKAQAIVIYGYEMLVEQGARSFEIWTGLTAPRQVMKKNLLGVFGEPA